VFHFHSRSPEQHARDYCQAIGVDPEEVVGGYVDHGYGRADWVRQPRWRWYLGVSDAALARPI
jgi:hypothetical protein